MSIGTPDQRTWINVNRSWTTGVDQVGSGTWRGVCIVAARCLLTALLSLAGGCTPVGWHRIDLTSRVSRREQIKVWSRGNVERWYAVVIGRDSVSGIPYTLPLDCDSCRRSVPLTEVDSLRAATPLGAWVGMVVGATAVVYGLIHAK